MTFLDKNIERFKKVDIYPVITSEFTAGRPAVDVLLEIAKGGAKIVQLREKSLSEEKLLEQAKLFRKITSDYDMLLIINDSVDLALAVNADGVHLGQDDEPIQTAKKRAPHLLIGSSSHNMKEALQAQKDGADYINIGPIYPTQTKTLSMDALGIEMLHEIKPLLNVPFTVMGGIKEHHLNDLIAAGAKHIAMVTEITQAEDIKKRVKELRSYFNTK